jgi:Rrf2 family protein
MAHITASVEYGMHSLLWLATADGAPVSCRDLAQLQGLSSSFLAKIFAKLEKAGIVGATEGIRGGYRLARKPKDISFLDVVDAIEGAKPLFNCEEIRDRCALFEGAAPAWATDGVCSVHAVMLRAEKAMRSELARQSLAELAQAVNRKAPSDFAGEVQAWIGERIDGRIKKPDAARAVGPIEGSSP